MAKMITWTNPSQREDGKAYGANDNKGYELAIYAAGGEPATNGVSIPGSWETSFDISTLQVYEDLEYGEYRVALRVVDKNDLYSPWSNAEPFTIDPAAPQAPFLHALSN